MMREVVNSLKLCGEIWTSVMASLEGLNLSVRIQSVRTMTVTASEPGHLIWVGGCLAGLVMEAEGGWYLQIGFGPFDREGLLFSNLADVVAWIASNPSPAMPS